MLLVHVAVVCLAVAPFGAVARDHGEDGVVYAEEEGEEDKSSMVWSFLQLDKSLHRCSCIRGINGVFEKAKECFSVIGFYSYPSAFLVMAELTHNADP